MLFIEQLAYADLLEDAGELLSSEMQRVTAYCKKLLEEVDKEFIGYGESTFQLSEGVEASLFTVERSEDHYHRELVWHDYYVSITIADHSMCFGISPPQGGYVNWKEIAYDKFMSFSFPSWEAKYNFYNSI